MSDRPIRRIYPGQSFRSSLRSTVLDVLTDPPTPVAECLFPDGSTVTGSPVRDSAGQWHADYVVPSTMGEGVLVHAWESTGAFADDNAYQERKMMVGRRSIAT